MSASVPPSGWSNGGSITGGRRIVKALAIALRMLPDDLVQLLIANDATATCSAALPLAASQSVRIAVA
jgi:hypothetical protein